MAACTRVMASMGDEDFCRRFDMSPINATSPGCPVQVPRVYHAVHASAKPPHSVLMNALANPGFKLNYHSDLSAVTFMRERCGQEVSDAYQCFSAPAFRADIFRFCALSSMGGVYLDSDLLSVVPLSDLVDPCAEATVGHDFPWENRPGVQMKIVAGRARAPLFRCMLRRILQHIRWRFNPLSALNVSGPNLLTLCSQEVGRWTSTSFKYMDTRNAAWPFSGLRNGTNLLAYEVPNESRHWRNKDGSDYNLHHRKKSIYSPLCRLKVEPCPDCSKWATPPPVRRPIRSQTVPRRRKRRPDNTEVLQNIYKRILAL